MQTALESPRPMAQKVFRQPAVPADTILVVDDQTPVVKICKEMVTALGYGVKTACSGTEALRVVSESTPGVSLVLLDVHLPDMTLEEVVRGLRRIDAGLKILLQSGRFPGQNEVDIESLGICGCLEKPFGFKELGRRLAEALS